MMKKIVVTLILLIFAYPMSVYAIEPKTGDEGDNTELSPIEKKIWEILEKRKVYDYVENELIAELAKLGEEAVPKLSSELYNDEFTVAALSAYALDEILGEKALSSIVKAYHKHILKDDNFKIGWLIEKYGDKALPYIKSELIVRDTEVRNDFIILIAFIDTDNSTRMLKNWFKEEKSHKLKLLIINYIFHKNSNEAIKKEYLNYIGKLLDDKDVNVKCKAIKTLRKIKDTTLLDKLEKLAVDAELCVRKETMKTLCSIASERAVNIVIRNLSHKCSETRTVAADVLSNITNLDDLVKDKIVDALLDALEDKDKQVRIAVIISLSVFCDLNEIKQLDEIAKNDTDKEVRNEAAEAIEDIKRNNPLWDDEEETDDEE